MELEILRSHTMSNAMGVSIPFLSFRKNGCISLSCCLVKMMDLRVGDHLLAVRNKSYRKDHYIIKSNTSEGFPLRATSGSKGMLCFNASSLTASLLGVLNENGLKTFRLKVSTASEPSDYGPMFLIILKLF